LADRYQFYFLTYGVSFSRHIKLNCILTFVIVAIKALYLCVYVCYDCEADIGWVWY